jgi:hypothetical protein
LAGDMALNCRHEWMLGIANPGWFSSCGFSLFDFCCAAYERLAFARLKINKTCVLKYYM